MQTNDFNEMSPELKEHFNKMFKTEETTLKKLNERLDESTGITMFERRKENLKDQTKK